MNDNSHIPERILKAILHIRESFPICSMVVFNADGRWQFMGEDFQRITFNGDEVDVSILEDAAECAWDETALPCVFQMRFDD